MCHENSLNEKSLIQAEKISESLKKYANKWNL